MGAIFIYISKEILQKDWSTTDLEGKVLKQSYATLLDKILRTLPQEHRYRFPYLKKMEFNSGYYHGEKTFLLVNEVKELKIEYDFIIDLVQGRQFQNGVNAHKLIHYLGEDSYPKPTKDEIIEELLQIKLLIDYAAEKEANIYINR